MARFSIEYKDQAARDLIDKYPRRVKWATGEAIQMAGGHYRKKLQAHFERGAGKPLSFITRRIKQARGLPERLFRPLYNLGKLVRYKYTGGKNPRARVGFFTDVKRGNTGFNRKERARFRTYFGVTPASLARKHEEGKAYRVTPEKRRMMAAMGAPLRASTRTVKVPARRPFERFWQQEKAGVGRYLKKRFLQKLVSAEGPFR